MYWAQAKRKVCIAGGLTLLKTLTRLVWSYVKEPAHIIRAGNPAVSITKSHEPPSRPKLVLGFIYTDGTV